MAMPFPTFRALRPDNSASVMLSAGTDDNYDEKSVYTADLRKLILYLQLPMIDKQGYPRP
jgi:hypothetical protein